MTDLCFATRFDNVDLAGDAICRAKVCFADEFEEWVAEILYETLRILKTVLRERIPDPRVGSCGGEVIALGTCLCQLSLDDGFVRPVGRVDGGMVCEEVLKNKNARTVDENVVKLILPCGLAPLAYCSTVVDRNVLLDVGGERICLFECDLFHERFEGCQGWRLVL